MFTIPLMFILLLILSETVFAEYAEFLERLVVIFILMIPVTWRACKLKSDPIVVPVQITDQVVAFGNARFPWEQVKRFYPYPANSFSKTRLYCIGVRMRSGIHAAERIPLDDRLTADQFNEIADAIAERVLPECPKLKIQWAKR